MIVFQRVLCFLSSFSTGMFLPVSSLVLLAHGATEETLPVFVGILSATILLVEVPSGIVADMFGRKKTFALAQIFLMTNGGFLMVGNSPGSLGIACVCHGLGLAFASGSLDALVLENFIKEHGKDKMSEMNRWLLMLQSSGLVCGSLLGGVLSQVGEKFVFLLLVIFGINGLLLVGTVLFVREEKRGVKESDNISLKDQVVRVKDMVYFFPPVKMVLVMALLTGCVQMVLETYWQQNFIGLLHGRFEWMLGVVSCLGFFAGMFGNYIGENFFRKWGKNGFRKMKIVLPIMVSIIGICENVLVFVTFFFVVYVMLGAGEYTERFILHSDIEDRCRASVLSLYSLVIRLGGILASLAAGFLMAGGSLMVWIAIPVSVSLLMLFFTS